MTDEQINRSIAEFCGWKPNFLLRDMSGKMFDQQPPDYVRDLNAMHEAKKVLTPMQEVEFADWVGFDPTDATYSDAFACIHATARQRAEAFLRAVNLYENDSK